MATEGTKYQINYKLADGTLINLYATTVQELETGLTDLSMVATLIKSTGKELGGVPTQPAPSVDAIAQAFNAQPVQLPSQSGSGNTCKHGVMALREGTSARGPWKGYMCAAPKGATDKCDTIWVRQQVKEPSQYEAPSCATIGGDFWFPDTKVDVNSVADTKFATSICNRCPHRRECAEWGITKEYFGIWGGLTMRQRQVIRSQRGIRLNQENDVA